MEKKANPISGFHGAGTDNSLPLKLGFFETKDKELALTSGTTTLRCVKFTHFA